MKYLLLSILVASSFLPVACSSSDDPATGETGETGANAGQGGAAAQGGAGQSQGGAGHAGQVSGGAGGGQGGGGKGAPPSCSACAPPGGNSAGCMTQSYPYQKVTMTGTGFDLYVGASVVGTAKGTQQICPGASGSATIGPDGTFALVLGGWTFISATITITAPGTVGTWTGPTSHTMLTLADFAWLDSGGQGGVGGASGAGGDAGQGGEAGQGGDAGAAGSSGAAGGPPAPSFAQVKAVFGQSCGASFGPMHCHGASPYEDDLDLTGDDASVYANLVNITAVGSPTKKRVVPGDPDSSFLLQKMLNQLASDQSEGEPMPKGEAIMWHPLPDDQLATIRAWIKGGALP